MATYRHDQVIVRGPIIRCVETFSTEDGTLEVGWTANNEEAYKADGTQ